MPTGTALVFLLRVRLAAVLYRFRWVLTCIDTTTAADDQEMMSPGDTTTAADDPEMVTPGETATAADEPEMVSPDDKATASDDMELVSAGDTVSAAADDMELVSTTKCFLFVVKRVFDGCFRTDGYGEGEIRHNETLGGWPEHVGATC